MKFAAVDIGSNAIRFQVTSVLNYNGVTSFKKTEYVRFPLRLGQDVFDKNEISPEKEAKFIKLIHSFKMLMELYEVDDHIICATSAMRESKNGKAIVYKVKELLGVDIKIIDGDEEADLINSVLYHELDNKSYIHIDVGGGSTELNIFINKKKIASNSFKIGSVRRLKGVDSPDEWKHMENWVKTHVKKEYGDIWAVGTGGNISKIYDLANPGQIKDAQRTIGINKIEDVQKRVSAMSLDERIHVLMLNPDRADVIIPASDIYLSVMKYANAKTMLVPELGLKDGLILMLYRKHTKDDPSVLINTNKYQR